MKPIGNSLDHYWRVIGMAKATDAKLVEAMDTHRLTSTEWANMVETCRRCDWVEGCDRLLANNPDLEQAPSQCLNCQRFAELTAPDRAACQG